MDEKQNTVSSKNKNAFTRRLDNIKDRAKTNFNEKRQEANQRTNQAAQNFSNGLKEAQQVKGLKNKAKALSRGTRNGLNSLKTGQKLVKAYDNIANKLKKHIKTIKIISAIIAFIIFIANPVMYVYSIVQSVGNTPHYYCEIDPSSDVRKSALYKQYCTNNIREVDENGIPVVPFMVQYNFGWMNPDTGTYEHDYSRTLWPGSSDPMGPDSCGPSAASMILSYYTGEMFFPDSSCFMSKMSTYYYHSGGTSFQAQAEMAKIVAEETGITVDVEIRNDFSISSLDEILSNGDMAVLLMGPNIDPSGSIKYNGNRWTDGGHFIAVIGKLPDGTYAVAESGSEQRSYWGIRYWDFGEKHSVTADAFTFCISTPTWAVYHSPENS